MADNRITLTLPPGILVYPKLDEPDVFVHPKTKKKGEPTYIANVTWEGEVLKQVQKTVTDAAKKITGEKDPIVPFRTIKPKNGDEIIVLVAKTKRKDKSGNLVRPFIVDAKNRKLPADVSIGGGTKAAVNVTLNMLPDGDGVHAYLNALQVLDLKTFSSPFAEADGYEYSGDTTSRSSSSSDDDTADEDSDESYKF